MSAHARMARNFNYAMLAVLAASALFALVGLAMVAGIGGFGFGVTLLIVGGIGLTVVDEVLDEREADR